MLAPILAVPDVQAAAEYYCDKLGFTVGFLYGDPPTHGGIHRGEWTSEGAHIQLSHNGSAVAAETAGGILCFHGRGC